MRGLKGRTHRKNIERKIVDEHAKPTSLEQAARNAFGNADSKADPKAALDQPIEGRQSARDPRAPTEMFEQTDEGVNEVVKHFVPVDIEEEKGITVQKSNLQVELQRPWSSSAAAF